MATQLTTLETIAVINMLCDRLKEAWGDGFGRVEHIQIARRLVELAESLPKDGDVA